MCHSMEAFDARINAQTSSPTLFHRTTPLPRYTFYITVTVLTVYLIHGKFRSTYDD